MEINSDNTQAAEGRGLFLQHKGVYLPETQHCQDDEGHELQYWCDELRQPRMLRQDVRRFVEFLQSKAITNVEEFVDRIPHLHGNAVQRSAP